MSRRDFNMVLRDIERGAFLDQMQLELDNAVLAVMEHRKGAKLTLTLSIKPTADNALNVAAEFKVVAPKPDRRPTLFFADDEGNLSRSDPRQTEMQLRDVSAKPEAPLKEIKNVG